VQLRRLDESAEIVVLERDRYVSFANCGVPRAATLTSTATRSPDSR